MPFATMPAPQTAEINLCASTDRQLLSADDGKEWVIFLLGQQDFYFRSDLKRTMWNGRHEHVGKPLKIMVYDFSWTAQNAKWRTRIGYIYFTVQVLLKVYSQPKANSSNC